MCSPVCTLLKLQRARESSVDLVKTQVLIQWVGKGLGIRSKVILRLHLQGPHIGRQGAKKQHLVSTFSRELASLRSYLSHERF